MDGTSFPSLPPSVLVLANGEPPSRALVRRLRRRCDCLVAADGGANTARTYGLSPDVIIGDLDSVLPGTRRAFRESLLLRVRRQDNTDLEKALDYIAAHGGRRVVITGITGRRIDFTLANLSILWNYSAFLDIVVAGDGWEAFPAGRRRTFRVRKGTTVSLIPFGPCDGITLRGLRYGLTNASMRVGEIGVSNVAVRSSVSVAVRRGNMLIILLTKGSELCR
jgi:thiamine pyrophosphokinase